MIEELRKHVELLFESAPKTHRAFDLKEELLANSIERYEDLIQRGVSEEDAFRNVVDSIGNVEELLDCLNSPLPTDTLENELHRKKAAMITSISVGIYILAGILFLATSMFGIGRVGLLLALIIIIIPTCLLVYNANAYPKYVKRSDTIVEDFKNWKISKQKNQAIIGAISSVLWTLTLVLYFVFSFATGAWYVTWIIFLISACFQTVITLVLKIKEIDK